MKLVVMIPCCDEEKTIASVIEEIPRDCCDEVEILVIDDGSTDNTVQEAEKGGADRILSFKKNKGLAPAFRAGLQAALEMGADIIVNTDGDGQYNGKEIPKLIEPILDNRADFVLGSRTKGHIEYMPLQKKIGNRIATFITRQVTGYPVSDAQSGFRAFTRDCAMRLNVMADYTYVQETLIQATYYGLVIEEVPIEFRRRNAGPSRLISNIWKYAQRAGVTIARGYRDFHPLDTFFGIGSFFILVGLLFGFRVLFGYFKTGVVAGYLPSAVLTVLLILIGVSTMTLGMIADILKTQRKIQDEILYRLKKMEYDNQ
ncbi:MAG: glycosyltransferase family 2 protein [Methanosarcina sp.]|uniref:glycosyltransferase family 2 protein n=1 Tax=Methanosarcina sp. TaxID=2213 RepID=UPI0026219D40|nr:glycosyltransferase family 2 protein [Methanosarcina sp.]MDD3245402.1 glycosyltransferase family 2 protein [Methanosarcina sp.]MDD4249512.1 glycosyltransferase family 2 protein [Methanosarcina sp.]